VSLELTLDTSSATGVRNNLVGACDGRFEIDATLAIVTADGALDESMPLVLTTWSGSSRVSAIVDLSDYDFAGTFELAPGWTQHEMRLVLSWDRDMQVLGMLTLGDDDLPQGQEDPEANSGVYALISAND
jgi:hypothetical protein